LGTDFLTINIGRAAIAATNHKAIVVTVAIMAVKRFCLGRQTEMYRSTEIAVRIRIEKFVAR